MSNYNRLGEKIKTKSKNFINKISNDLNKTEYKFLFQLFYGLLDSGSVLLSEISRSLKEDITLKKTIDRLSRNLMKFDKIDEVHDQYIDEISKQIDDETVFCIDHTDIAKPNSTKLEDLGRVRDGSTGKIEDGYKILEVAALTKENKLPISVISELFSPVEDSFVSENRITLNALRYLSKKFGDKGIRTLDRGFDNKRFYDYFLDKNEKFIIRAKVNRNVIHKGKSKNILMTTKEYKGKYALTFKQKNKKPKKVKISYIPIKLPAFPQKELTLVAVYGLGKKTMMLITNITSDKKIISKTVLKVYLLRWRIEDYFKFKKQRFDFENIRVRKIKSIRNMNRILTLVIGFIGLLSQKQDKTVYMQEILKNANAIYSIEEVTFTYYRIVDGIRNTLEKIRTGIEHLLPNAKYVKSQQISLFKRSYINCFMEMAS